MSTAEADENIISQIICPSENFTVFLYFPSLSSVFVHKFVSISLVNVNVLSKNHDLLKNNYRPNRTLMGTKSCADLAHTEVRERNW